MSQRSKKEQNKSIIIFFSILGVILVAIAVIAIVSGVNNANAKRMLVGSWDCVSLTDGSAKHYEFDESGKMYTRTDSNGMTLADSHDYRLAKGNGGNNNEGYIVIDNEGAWAYTVDDTFLYLTLSDNSVEIYKRTELLEPGELASSQLVVSTDTDAAE